MVSRQTSSQSLILHPPHLSVLLHHTMVLNPIVGRASSLNDPLRPTRWSTMCKLSIHLI